MADEREGAEGSRQSPATENRIQSGGREANAAQPLNASRNKRGAERYPPVDRTDAAQGEHRSFDPAAETPAPRQGAGDTSPHSTTDGRLGPGGDPAEGKP